MQLSETSMFELEVIVKQMKSMTAGIKELEGDAQRQGEGAEEPFILIPLFTGGVFGQHTVRYNAEYQPGSPLCAETFHWPVTHSQTAGLLISVCLRNRIEARHSRF